MYEYRNEEEEGKGGMMRGLDDDEEDADLAMMDFEGKDDYDDPSSESSGLSEIDDDDEDDDEEKDGKPKEKKEEEGEDEGEADEGEEEAPVHVLPLFAMLPPHEQARVFQPPPSSPVPHRLIIVSTNVAETSVTIPGIKVRSID